MKDLFIKAILASFLVSATVLPISGYAQNQYVPERYNPTSVGSKLEIHVNDDGRTTIGGVQVIQTSGSTIYGRTMWEETAIRWAIRTSDKTTILRKYGGNSNVGEISSGDYISIEGNMVGGSDAIVVNATSVKNWSLQKEGSVFSGVVGGSTTQTDRFILITKDGSEILISFGTSTSMTRGAIAITPNDLKIGEKILSASGVYNFRTKTLDADTVRVYQNQSIFIPRNFEGELKELSETSLPTVAIVLVGDKTYKVYLNEKVGVLSFKKEKASLKRFIVGDKIRFYGKIRNTNFSEIDAEVIRNMSL